ncbi:MAG: GHKL domain-containing protein [Alphaproteobacteria bacterium]|nr:MAG: GHKL domain-containing protein [Alphaproteobacteria bacterium]
MIAPRKQLSSLKKFVSREVPNRWELMMLVGYGILFALLNWSALPWAGAGFFSLWYPAAGLRFFVLWRFGLRYTPWLMATELCADWLTGTVPFTGPGAFGSAWGALRPGLAYGVALASVRSLARRGSGALTFAPMPMGLAAIAAPALNALLVEPFRLFLPAQTSPILQIDAIISLTGLAVGDMLGILVLAPPLLWIFALIEHREMPRVPQFRLRPVLEDASVLSACLLLTVALWRAGLGIQPIPSLLAGAWIGLRHGRAAAWFAILAQVAVFLPWSTTAADDPTRLTLHLGLSAVVLVAWLAGSFTDAQVAARAIRDRRNRLLFQAERLKTLRAMSVAVIHEISQPLSTLAIEAAHLKDLTSGMDLELATGAAIIDRKAHTLSEMVRSLRRFGGRAEDEHSLLSVEALVQSAAQITAHEYRELGCMLELVRVAPELVIQAQEIELTQALVNLLRNAAGASASEDNDDRSVSLKVQVKGDFLEIVVENRSSVVPSKAGMGVGLIIARSIVEAHGGTLEREHDATHIRFVISVPLAGAQS